jgi:hypothetical protein
MFESIFLCSCKFGCVLCLLRKLVIICYIFFNMFILIRTLHLVVKGNLGFQFAHIAHLETKKPMCITTCSLVKIMDLKNWQNLNTKKVIKCVNFSRKKKLQPKFFLSIWVFKYPKPHKKTLPYMKNISNKIIRFYVSIWSPKCS